MDCEHKQSSWVDKLNLYFQGLQARVLKTPLKVMTDWGIGGNGITNSRLLLGALFLFLFGQNQIAAGFLMILIFVLDTLDGALARFQNKASDRGKFLDIFIDSIIYSFIIFTFLGMGVDALSISFNIFIIPIAYLLGIIKKQEFEESDWIIKPYPKLSYLRTITVVPFFLFIFWNINFLNTALLISNTLATAISIYYFIYIQIRWNKIYHF